MLQNTKSTETAQKLAFSKVLEDKPGGITIAVASLGGDTLYAGTPVGKGSNGLFEVIKTAKVYEAATSAATQYKVEKGHHLKVGQQVAKTVGGANYAITAIDTSDAAFDLITVGTTLGVALSVGDILFESGGTAGASSGALKYTPYGHVAASQNIEAGNNHFAGCVVRGTVLEAGAPPIHSAIKTALPLMRYE